MKAMTSNQGSSGGINSSMATPAQGATAYAQCGRRSLGTAADVDENARMQISPTSSCPCGRDQTYAACCGRYHAGEAAPDAESLMRSRYSAYVTKDVDYLLASWHPDTRPATLSLDDAPGQRTQWLGLSVQRHVITGEDTAEVEFTARYRVGGGSAVKMVEHSRFQRIDGRWYYLDAAGT